MIFYITIKMIFSNSVYIKIIFCFYIRNSMAAPTYKMIMRICVAVIMTLVIANI